MTTDGTFAGSEHVIPRSLGPATDDYVITPGGVCDACNHWLGRQVDPPFVNRFDIRLTRGLERTSGRHGPPPIFIPGRDACARLTLELEGGRVVVDAARADERPGGGLEIEIRPVERDPDDVVARTVRALWKIALGCAFLARGRDALDPQWDHLRRAVLGAPFNGFLFQAPFTARVTRELAVHANFTEAARPDAITFVMGGVGLAAPLADGAQIDVADARGAGLTALPTNRRAPAAHYFRLDPEAD